jgi:hypothetical protein
MTEYLKKGLIALFALAILVLPSSALVACDSSGDCENGTAPSVSDTVPGSSPGEDNLSRGCVNGNGGSLLLGRFGYPPVASDSEGTVIGDTPLEITLQATDPDGDPLTYSIVSGPSAGSLAVSGGNTVVYTPVADFAGGDSFSFQAHDGFWDSNTATVSLTVLPDSIPKPPQAFYGMVTIDGEPAPANTTIRVSGPGVLPNTSGNPLVMVANGSYGSPNNTTQMLVVEGWIENDTPLVFSVNGVPADVHDPASNGPWQPAYPFQAGTVTNLDLRATGAAPQPDDVYINALSVTIKNPIYGYYQTVRVEKNPWVEIRVTRGVFDIEILATGYHDFRTPYPILGRNATLAICENGNPVTPEVPVAFGSRTAKYAFLANETRTFDILMYVPDNPDIRDEKHVTIFTSSDPEDEDTAAAAAPGGDQAFVEACG